MNSQAVRDSMVGNLIRTGGWLRLKLLVLLFAVLAGAMAPLTAVQAQPNADATQVVRSKTQELIDLLNKNRKLYEADEDKFFRDVDALLSPVIDIDRIARRVMAKYYRQASEEQTERFTKVFKQSLMNIYAKGLLQYDNQRIDVLPPGPSNRETQQKVDVDVYSKDGKRYPLSYSMFIDDEGHWKIENIVVNGINIGLTYRNQFSRLMRENRNDIDKVIASWTSEVVETGATD